MNRDYLILLVMVEEINFLLENYKNVSVEDLTNMSSRSLERAFETMGEHAKRVSLDIKQAYPLVNWKDIAGIRDVMAHDYGSIDHEMLLSIVNKYLENTLTELNKIVKNLEVNND